MKMAKRVLLQHRVDPAIKTEFDRWCVATGVAKGEALERSIALLLDPHSIDPDVYKIRLDAIEHTLARLHDLHGHVEYKLDVLLELIRALLQHVLTHERATDPPSNEDYLKADSAFTDIANYVAKRLRSGQSFFDALPEDLHVPTAIHKRKA